MKILLVDDHPVVRSGLARVLRPYWEKIGEAGDLREALQLAAAEAWDLVVVDAMLGEADGLELAGKLRQLYPGLHLMILSMHSDPGLVRRAVRLGVRAFVVKDAQPEEVVAATLAARFGCLYMDRRVAPSFLQGGAMENRQDAILDGLRRGLSNQEIAESVHLSLSSVKMELRSLFTCYGVKDRNGLLKILNL